MKKLIYILIIIGLFSCKPQKEMFEKTGMQSQAESNEIEFSLKVNGREKAQLMRRFSREEMILDYHEIGFDKYIILLTEEQIEKTVKDKGKWSVIPKKYDPRVREAIYYEIN